MSIGESERLAVVTTPLESEIDMEEKEVEEEEIKQPILVNADGSDTYSKS